MTAVLPHAPPTPKAGVPSLKVPAALVPTKPGSHAEAASSHPKSKFQDLLDHASHGAKAGPASAPTNQPELVKAPKPKAVDASLEKPKETKKPEAKDHREKATADQVDNLWAAVLHAQPKTDPVSKPVVPAANAGGETVGSATEKAKAPKDLRRPGTDGLNIALASQVNAEAARVPGNGPSNKADRSEDKQKVFVVDRRSDKEKDKLKVPGAEAAAQQPVNASVEVQPQTKVADPKSTADIQVTFQTVTGKGADGFDLKGNQAPVSPRDAATFQQYLVEKGYGQLVDQARIVLKDQNAGEIRMTLYPESLGKVKVSLNLDDKSLAGQIYVENQTVKDVFQANMDGLMQAFRDGGYNDLSLQVSVGNGNGGGNASQDQSSGQAPARDYGRQVTQTVSAEGRNDRIGSWNDRQINLTA